MTLPWAHGMTIREESKAFPGSAGYFGANSHP